MKISNGVNKKISTPVAIIIILACAILVAGLTFWQNVAIPKEEQEVKIPSKEEDILKEIAFNLIDDYLNQFKSSDVDTTKRLKSYSINKIDIGIIVEDQCFGFTVTFSVETFGDSDWRAGNGKIVGNWVNNKSMFVDVIKEDADYKIREMGTGRASASCLGPKIAEEEIALTEPYITES